MQRRVGDKDRSEFTLDPVAAWRRGRKLDRMLTQAGAKRVRGVSRAPHAEFNRRDDRWAVEAARVLNPGKRAR